MFRLCFEAAAVPGSASCQSPGIQESSMPGNCLRLGLQQKECSPGWLLLARRNLPGEHSFCHEEGSLHSQVPQGGGASSPVKTAGKRLGPWTKEHFSGQLLLAKSNCPGKRSSHWSLMGGPSSCGESGISLFSLSLPAFFN